MKSSFLKIVLPAFAILLAVGLAFATEESNMPVTGYISSPNGPLPVQTDCPDTGQGYCFKESNPVYRTMDLEIQIRDWE